MENGYSGRAIRSGVSLGASLVLPLPCGVAFRYCHLVHSFRLRDVLGVGMGE